MDYRKKLLARPGDKIRLKDYDPGWHGAHADEKAAAEETARHLDRIAGVLDAISSAEGADDGRVGAL